MFVRKKLEHILEGSDGTNDELLLLEYYRPYLRALAISLTTRDQAEDLAQEGWIAMWRAYHSHNGAAPIDYWMEYKAKNEMIRLSKMKKGTGFIGGKQPIIQGIEPVDPVDLKDVQLVHEAYELAYHYGEIQQAIDSLTPKEREYILIRFYLGLKGKELTSHFGYEPSNVWTSAKKRLSLALEHLRGCY